MRRISLAVLAFLVAGASTVAAVDVDGMYLSDPFRKGDITIGARPCSDAADITSCVGVGIERGGAFLRGMAIRNARRLPVTITDISEPDNLTVSLDQVRLGDEWPGVDISQTSPFEPFTLQPGEQRMVYLIEQTTPCANMEAGDEVAISGMTITYRWLATEHEQQVATPKVRLGYAAC